MPMTAPEAKPASRSVSLDWVAGVLSYLVPGMGQISQGRISKGVLFFVSIYALFFYGMYLGSWENVYLPDTKDRNDPWSLPRPLANLYNRPQFAGQFWVGIAAWPAVWQYNFYKSNKQQGGPLIGKFQRQPNEEDLNALERNGDKTRDLGWVFTVMAGVLNIMVIYDAVAGPAFRAGQGQRTTGTEARHVAAVAAGK
jgi:hypothetical protein